MAKIAWTEEAQHWLEDIFEYIAADNPAAAARTVEGIYERVQADALFRSADKAVVRRGEIWWASLPEPSGSGLGFRRPVLIVSANSFNESRINTVIAAAVPSNLRLADAPGNVRLPARSARLAKPSVVNVSQLVTIDKAFLTEPIGHLPPRLLAEVEEGLRLVLSL